MDVIAAKYVGTKIRLTGTFTAAGPTIPVDPDTVAVDIRRPNGVFVSFTYGVNIEVTRLTVGVYEFRYVLDQRGRWWFGFSGFGGASPVVATEEVSVIAKRRSSIAA